MDAGTRVSKKLPWASTRVGRAGDAGALVASQGSAEATTPGIDASPAGVRIARLTELIKLFVSVAGYLFAAQMFIIGFSTGQWPFPGGDVAAYYAPAGDALRSGAQVYAAHADFPGFRYGPPWAVALAALSWLGPALIHGIIVALDVVALWVISGGNARRLGYYLWFPLIPFEIAAGQLNLLIAAAVVVAQRGTTWPLAALSFAKVWPVLALRPSDWRPFLVACGLIALVTVPWVSLWPAWIGVLLQTAETPYGPVIPIPFIARGVAALALIALQRPWSRALGVAIVSPNLYWGQLVILVAPISILLGRRETPA